MGRQVLGVALALMLPNIVASAPISGPLGLSISNEKLILPALQFGDGVSGDTTWLKLVPFDWQLFKTVSLTSSSMGEPLVGLLVAILLGGGAALVLVTLGFHFLSSAREAGKPDRN